jgi:uncharacterized protein (DUF302 family)
MKSSKSYRNSENINEGGMSYYFSKRIKGTFNEVLTKVAASLKEEGFGILTEIDVKETLKKKLDVNFHNYMILGACNPPFAYKALLAENKIGIMLPCNVVVQEEKEGEIEVAAVDPVASMKAIENPDLFGIAQQVREKLKKVVVSL